MDQYQTFIAASRYARWLPEEGRREAWPETVNRYLNFWMAKEMITPHEAADLYAYIVDLEVMPSMRCLMTAGLALERDNVAGFNCSYLPIDHPRAFDELAYILLCGTGVGFSVETKYTKKLPEVPEEFYPTDTTIVVADSKIGWAKALRQLLSLLWAGEIPAWDVSRVRPAGAPLKTFGGRASGPGPLVDLFRFAIDLFKGAKGRHLTELECHDLCCKIAEIIVVGGVRRSALISLSDPVSDRMRSAKSGAYWQENPQRNLANNSAVYDRKPDFDFFLKEMHSLYESRTGERGIFSRQAAKKIAERNGRREADVEFGTNPCSEIILRPNQFCNLSEVVVRAEDTLEDLKDKVRKATILGTLQATLTDFRYLRPIWKKNTEEEALLGVSLTGIYDHPVLRGDFLKVMEVMGPDVVLSLGKYGDDELDLPHWLEELKDVAIETNREWAERLGINPSVAITCVKPSGTVSQLVNSSSGIHPRYSRHYVRTVRADRKDPLAMYMAEAGFPCEDDIHNPTNLVFGFPIASPDSPTASEVSALEQLELWKVYAEHWCEHKPSMTCYYREHEFLDVASWIWKNFDICSGISFLPYSDHVYAQAPYQPIDEDKYNELKSALPEFDLGAANSFEAGVDSTIGSQELACAGGSCELP